MRPPDFIVSEEDAPPNIEMIAQVRDAARRTRDLLLTLSDLDSQINEKKKELTALKTQTLPDLLNAAKLTALTLEPEGNTPAYEVELKPWYSAAIDKDNPAPAHNWLEEHGYGDIIKHTFTISFSRDEHEKVREFRELLNKLGWLRNYEEKRSVHPSTLQAFVKEQIEEYGTALPRDLLHLEVGQMAKIGELKVQRKRGRS